MKKTIFSVILITTLLITSCSASKGASPSEEAQTSSEATTEEVTTTTTEVTTTTTEAKDPISSLPEVVEMANSALGKDFDTALAIVEDAFATSFTLSNDIYHAAGEEYYDEDTYISEYDCNIIIEGYSFDYVSFTYHEDKSVYNITLGFHSSDSSELMNLYEYSKAVYSSLFDGSNSEENGYSSTYWTAYGPVDGITYEIWYWYFGGDQKNSNTALLTFILE